MFDFIIRDGIIADGSGHPSYKADIGVVGDRIAEIGNLAEAASADSYDAAGKIVCPGFIDIHTHSDLTLLLDWTCESHISQGVTTQVIGNCGMSAAPIEPGSLSEVEDSIPFLLSGINATLDWNDWDQYFSRLQKSRPVTNVAALAGHGTLRANIAGMRQEKLGNENLGKISDLLSRSIESGVVGMSTGLIYPPGSFADLAELKTLMRILARHDRVYTSHLRGYRGMLDECIGEAVEIAGSTGGSVHISHLKAAGKVNRGRGEKILQQITEAIESGVNVGFDVYPYEAGNTTLLSIFPPWVRAGGRSELKKRLSDPETRKDIERSLYLPLNDWEPLLEKDEWESILLVSFRKEKNKEFEGLNLNDIASRLRKAPFEAACDLLLEEDLVLNMINFHVDETDIETMLRHPACVVASDSLAVGKSESIKGIRPHPRYYGTFTRILSRYVREKNMLPLESAIYKMSGLPAKCMGIADRGVLSKGKAADIVVFDPAEVSDKATYLEPALKSQGICRVFVNGVSVFSDGDLTGSRPGMVVLRKN